MAASGYATDGNWAAAAEEWERAAALGHVPSYAALAQIYYEGRSGVPRWYGRAAELAAIGADKGCGDCKVWLTRHLMKLCSHRVELFRRSILISLSPSRVIQAVLSNCYLHGVGVAASDASTALLLAQESTSLNNANGAVRLGYLLQFGKAGPKDLPAAAKFYKMASDRGHAEGLYRLAAITQTGDGVAADECRFGSCWRLVYRPSRAAMLGFCAVLSKELHLTILFGRAAQLCAMAAEKGFAAAQ